MLGSSYRVGSRHRSKTPLLVTGIALACIAGGGAIAWQVAHPRSPVSATVQRQLDFSPFVPHARSGVTVSSQKYDSQNKGYSYILTLQTGQKFTVSEQASPPNFSEIPESYTKLLDGLHQYDTLETINGTVTLVHPQSGQTAAVMNEKGVLMFVRSDGAQTSNATWKRVIELLDIYKIPSN